MNLKNKISKKSFVLATSACINQAWIVNSIDNFKKAVKWNNKKYRFNLKQTSLENEDDFYGVAPFDLTELYPDYDEEDSENGDSVTDEDYKRVYEQIKKYLLKEENVVNSSIIDGNLVGQLAREYFDILLTKENLKNNKNYYSLNTAAYINTKNIIELTNESLKDKNCKYIYEAGFEACDGNLITKCDILEIVDHEKKIVKIHEVKASTDKDLKWKQIYDLFYQIIVLEECGYKVEDVSLVLLNRFYSNSDDYLKIESDDLKNEPPVLYEEALKIVEELDKLKEDKFKIFSKECDPNLEKLFSINTKKNYYKKDYKIIDLYRFFYNSFADLGKKGLERFLVQMGQDLNSEDIILNKCQALSFSSKESLFLISNSECGHALCIEGLDLEYPTVLDINSLAGSKKAKIINNPNENPYLSIGEQLKSFDLNKGKTSEIGAILYNFWDLCRKEGYVKKTEQDIMPEWLFSRREKIDNLQELLDFYMIENKRVYMYDFETVKYAVPRFQYMPPYSQVPFQYSIHVLKDGKFDYKDEKTMEHRFWIAKENTDPRVGFVKNFLKDMFCEGKGIYVAYNKSFEKSVIRNLIEAFPMFKKPLLYIFQNTHDLMYFFKKSKEYCYIYQPKFEESFSIKKTQPSLDSSISYKELRINNGLMASEIFRNFLDGNISKKMWADNVREDMIKYCNRDTLAMVVVLQRVNEIFSKSIAHNEKWGFWPKLKKINVVFAGTIEISKEILETLLDLEYINIVGVVCQPDREVGRKKVIQECEVKQFAKLHNLKIFQPEKINDIYEEIKKLNGEYLITCAFGQFVSQRILDLFKDCYNIHGSLLPKYRGGSPLQKSIANGDKITGVSIMRMVKKMDAGPVFVSKEFEINEDENAYDIFKKAGEAGSELLRRNLRQMISGEIKPTEQDESKVTFAYNLKNEEEHVTFDKKASDVHNFIRSLSPKPIAFAFIDEMRVKIKKTQILHDFKIKGKFSPGEIVDVDKKGIIVACSKNTFIRILEIQREGKNMELASQYHKNRSIFENNKIFK